MIVYNNNAPNCTLNLSLYPSKHSFRSISEQQINYSAVETPAVTTYFIVANRDWAIFDIYTTFSTYQTQSNVYMNSKKSSLNQSLLRIFGLYNLKSFISWAEYNNRDDT